MVLCALLYRQLTVLLRRLRQQALTTNAQVAAAVAPELARRHDAWGDLGRAFDGMADRLQGQTPYQCLLRHLSHELRTPLSRLQVLRESQDDAATLRVRPAREVRGLQQLVELNLEWPGWIQCRRSCRANPWRWRRYRRSWSKMPSSKPVGRAPSCIVACPQTLR